MTSLEPGGSAFTVAPTGQVSHLHYHLVVKVIYLAANPLRPLRAIVYSQRIALFPKSRFLRFIPLGDFMNRLAISLTWLSLSSKTDSIAA